MNKRTFAEFQKVASLTTPIKCARGLLYQCKTLPEHVSPHNWGISVVVHFDGTISMEKWMSRRCEVEAAITGAVNLKNLVTLIPYCEIGSDFLVSCKPPYDGGYSADMLKEWMEYKEGGAPPDGCVDSYAKLEKEVSALAMSLPIHSEGTFVLEASLSVENSDLFYADSRWLLFEIVEEVCDRHANAQQIIPADALRRR